MVSYFLGYNAVPVEAQDIPEGTSFSHSDNEIIVTRTERGFYVQMNDLASSLADGFVLGLEKVTGEHGKNVLKDLSLNVTAPEVGLALPRKPDMHELRSYGEALERLMSE
ncbi:MAG: hypothetical protein ABIG93_02795 [archaeon]|nr:hypothetical protein [Nanoarchaeota archaeon]